jgi:RNA polymerase sigma-70 factor (ECF subfamily)
MIDKHQEVVTRAFEDARDDVYRYLLTLGLQPPEAQDATQDVFLRLYTSLVKGEKIHSIRGWIFRVAHNISVDVRAKKQPLPLDLQAESMLRDHRRGVDMDLIEHQRTNRVAGAWKTLSPQQRECLYLRSEGLRYRQIAETLGISISSVREFLSRAIVRLQRAANE